MVCSLFTPVHTDLPKNFIISTLLFLPPFRIKPAPIHIYMFSRYICRASSESNKFHAICLINHLTCSREICIVVQPYTSGFYVVYVFPILELEKPQDDQRWSSPSTLNTVMCRHEQGGFGTFREGLSMEQFISYLLSYLSQS